MPFSARKMHFFDKNGNLTTCSAQLSADVKELFFREVILHQFLKRKKWALQGKNVQAILTHLNLAQKVPFLEDLKKNVSPCSSPGQGSLDTKYSDVWIIWIRHVWRTWSCVGLPCSGLLANQEVKKKLFSWRIWKDTFTQSFHWYWCYNSIVRETVSNVT